MIKLYETNSYDTVCECTVTDSFKQDNRFYIRLDQSIFFPEEGGQYADTGILTVISLSPDAESSNTLSEGDEIELLDGKIKRGLEDDVVYEVASHIPKGTRLRGTLNWDIRYDRMQNHSGEHVLTGTIHKNYGFNNVGFHLSDDGPVTLDFDGSLTYEEALLMEEEANRAIFRNLPIVDSYPSKAELCTIDYRSKIEIEGQVRLITIGRGEDIVDVCACCAPHVKRTGEIGIIKVINVIKWKKGVQITILCGRRALQYINNEHNILRNLSRDLSTATDNIPGVVKSYQDEIAALKGRLSDVYESWLLNEISLLGGDAPGCIFTDYEITVANMKKIYNALCQKFEGRAIGVFIGNDERGYRFSAGISGGDARILGNTLREKLSAKGGGSPEMIQGQVMAAKEEIIKLFK